MSDGDFEIEFLDEDADLVQQCVQGVDVLQQDPSEVEITSLLVERAPKRKKKPDDDSDYSPGEEIAQLKKRKSMTITVNKGSKMPTSDRTPANQKQPDRLSASHRPPTSHRTPTSHRPPTVERRETRTTPTDKPTSSKFQVKAKTHLDFELPKNERRGMDIHIPDYEDPLCLPVKSIIRDLDDSKKVKNWNKLCINRLEHADTCLVPEQGNAVRSQRTVVLRNMKHKLTGKIDTTIWSKVSVENSTKDRKSEVFQCILPKFREKSILNFYLESRKKSKQSVHMVNQVILCKEDSKDGEQLVTYKPDGNVAAVYKTFNRDDDDEPESAEDDLQKGNIKTYLKEVTNCKMCAPCYQTSWRGQQTMQKKNIECSICQRSYVSVYNLLAHVKSGHDASQVRRHRNRLSRVLAQLVEYHYKCRICNCRLPNIKDLRKHITTHQGKETFICEIGNHNAR